ncbi:flavin-containing monooxygenase [Rhodococcus wratislaviensis]|uniref:flavin-containing monooxygenase n=1 Tax=Rhodococcus wratislaviensis TaxID=44752 RepID=UPI003648379D
MTTSRADHQLDVVIVGAGITGIAAAAQLQANCPDKTFVVLEQRDNIGGTWDLFKYPGIRSDSDMFTLGYAFKPWTDPRAIASAQSIKNYLAETIDELGLSERIRLGTQLTGASWDSSENLWTLTLTQGDDSQTLRCRHLYLGSGYYSYTSGYNPAFPGEDEFDGQVIHPQFWPTDLDYKGKTIAVIGSGATAITLIPNLADDAAHVTMVQRSPSYVHIESAVDEELIRLREEVGAEAAFAAVRARNLDDQQQMFAKARQDPETFKKALFDAIDAMVGEDIRREHFTPSYEPWDQRVCVVPDADLFLAIADGRASVATGQIERINARGIQMQDGTFVDADIIVKATGFNAAMGGGVEISVDGRRVDLGDCWTYKGLAYSGIPNMVYGFGFFNHSWTLRIEIVNEYWCRILKHMDEIGAERFTPLLSPGDEDMTAQPYIEGATSGYLRRGAKSLPRQGTREPWTNPQHYTTTLRLLETIDDGVLRYER